MYKIPMDRVCCKCNKHMGVKEVINPSQGMIEQYQRYGKVESHGYCDECLKAEMSVLNRTLKQTI